MMVGHNYPDKEILLMRIAEEANLLLCECSIDRSDHRRIHVNGKKGSSFQVIARYGLNQGWKVCTYTCCDVPMIPILPPMNDAVEEELGEDEDDDGESVGMRNDPQIEQGDADSSEDEFVEKATGQGRMMRSPIKSRWIVPLIKEHIAERPNMSNIECRQLLNLYVRDVFLTKQILQSARSSAKFELFGDPVENAHYTRAMLREATARGHNVMSISKTSSEVMAMLESMVAK